jgi:hypothetical protein
MRERVLYLFHGWGHFAHCGWDRISKGYPTLLAFLAEDGDSNRAPRTLAAALCPFNLGAHGNRVSVLICVLIYKVRGPPLLDDRFDRLEGHVNASKASELVATAAFEQKLETLLHSSVFFSFVFVQ